MALLSVAVASTASRFSLTCQARIARVLAPMTNHVLPFGGDLGVGFVAGKLVVAKSAAVFLREVVGEDRGCLLVVVDGLTRDWD